MLDLQLFASILGALYASVFGTVMCFHFFATMLWLGLKCSTRGFPSYRGLIWFCTGLGGPIFLKLEGNIMSDPSPWYLFNLRCMSHGFYEEIRVSEISMSVEGLRRCSQVHILFSCGSRLHTFDKVCKEHIIKSSTFCFHFGSTVGFHFWYRNVLPFLYHIAMADIEEFHKGVPELQGSNLV